MLRHCLSSLLVATLAVAVFHIAVGGEVGQADLVRSYDGRTLPASQIRVEVPERRDRNGSRIAIAALRIPSTATQPGPPIVFLMGGPGVPGSVMVPIPPYFTLFSRLRELGDVVIPDQRGIGESRPTLDCPFDATLPVDVFLERMALVVFVKREVASCTASLRAKGIEPTSYTTLESADDLDDLRKALQVDQMDLLAFSYGSRLALAYVQHHPTRVRRLVLQGVSGPGLVIKDPAAVRMKLQRLGELLKADVGWQESTELDVAARAARARLAGAPARVTIRDHKVGRSVSVRVGRDGLDAVVGLSLDDVRLPALLVSVAAGDDRVLAQFVEAAWNGLSSGSVGFLGRAINCSADRPRSRRNRLMVAARKAPFGYPIDNEFLTDEFCRAVGYASAPIEFRSRVSSDVPALLVTGTLDATNPIANAVEVAAGFRNAVALEVQLGAHEALPIPGVQDAVFDFLRGVDVRGRSLRASLPRWPSVEEAAKPVAPRR